jgi:hypothetical protein
VQAGGESGYLVQPTPLAGGIMAPGLRPAQPEYSSATVRPSKGATTSIPASPLSARTALASPARIVPSPLNYTRWRTSFPKAGRHSRPPALRGARSRPWHCSPRRCPTPAPSITVCTGRANQSHALVGEIDFAIINPAGDLLLIEQESGCIRPLPRSTANRLFGGQIKSSSLACF